jgi:hypothetical protein
LKFPIEFQTTVIQLLLCCQKVEVGNILPQEVVFRILNFLPFDWFPQQEGESKKILVQNQSLSMLIKKNLYLLSPLLMAFCAIAASFIFKERFVLVNKYLKELNRA